MKNENLDSASSEIESSSDLKPLQSIQSEGSTPETLYESKPGSASLDQQVSSDHSPDSSTETTTIAHNQTPNLIYNIPDSEEFQGLSTYQNSSYPSLGVEFDDQPNQTIDSSDHNHHHQFPNRLDLFTSTESKPINTFSHQFHEFSNQTHYNLNSNYDYFPVSNSTTNPTTFPLSIIHQDENLINNLSTHSSTLAPLLSPSHDENSNHPNYLNHHSINALPCMINGSTELITSYYGPHYQSSSPTSHFDRSFPSIKNQSTHSNHLSSELNHNVGLLYHSNQSNVIYNKIEEINPRTISPLRLPNLNTNLSNHHHSKIDGGSSSTNSDLSSVYDRRSSAGSCQTSRAGSETFSRSNGSENLEINHQFHQHQHHQFDLNKEINSNLNQKSNLDQNGIVDRIQRNELISNAVQHLTTQVPRRRLTIEQEQVLIKRFSIQEYLSKREMEELAESLKIPTSQLRTWFGNRRSKLKAAARQRAKLEAGMGHLSDAELKSLNKRINGNNPKSKPSTPR